MPSTSVGEDYKEEEAEPSENIDENSYSHLKKHINMTEQPLNILITGASSGLGLALTRLFLTTPHTIIATSRNPSAHPQLQHEIQSTGSKINKFITLDPNAPSTPTTIQNLNLPIDVLINNAGWSLHGPVESITEDEARAQMETAYFGPYRLIRAVVPGMRERRRGLVVNVSSGAGVNGRESMGPYAAGKSAMDGLMRVLAREMVPFGVRTLNVVLGAFDTNFTNDLAITATPFPEDYNDHAIGKVLGTLGEGNFTPDGDHKKAAKVIYDMILGEGVGAGKEKETQMVLGRDMWKSIEDVDQKTRHMMATFKETCNNVYLDK